MIRHNINPIVVINGIITRADVAEIVSILIGTEFVHEIRMANTAEIKKYLECNTN